MNPAREQRNEAARTETILQRAVEAILAENGGFPDSAADAFVRSVRPNSETAATANSPSDNTASNKPSKPVLVESGTQAEKLSLQEFPDPADARYRELGCRQLEGEILPYDDYVDLYCTRQSRKKYPLAEDMYYRMLEFIRIRDLLLEGQEPVRKLTQAERHDLASKDEFPENDQASRYFRDLAGREKLRAIDVLPLGPQLLSEEEAGMLRAERWRRAHPKEAANPFESR